MNHLMNHFSGRSAELFIFGSAAMLFCSGLAAALLVGCGAHRAERDAPNALVQEPTAASASAPADLVAAGQRVFRFETFGDEVFWTDALSLHEVIQQSVDPTTALGVGLKVDADVLPPGLLEQADLADPATTVALLKLNAVVGLQGTVDANGRLTRIGVTCALCHSTVDDSVAPGIGSRMDGWPNVDLNVGAIIALSPALTDDQREVYESWGPGFYDPRYNLDGKNTPLVLPPAYGLADVKNATYTADGSISYWNAYVAVTQMHGQGNFSEPRLGIKVEHSPDRVTPKLPELAAYQHSLLTPPPPAGSFDSAAAERGKKLFNKSCATCHVNGSGTDNNRGVLHKPAATGMNGDYAARTVNQAYRTTPLRGLWQHPPYFHDGSADTLADVVSHYDRVRKLGLTRAQQQDLTEYLKTL